MTRSQNTWYLRVWQRAKNSFLVLATKESAGDTEVIFTDGQELFSFCGPTQSYPDCRLLLACPTAKISPRVRAFIRAALDERHDRFCDRYHPIGPCNEIASEILEHADA